MVAQVVGWSPLMARNEAYAHAGSGYAPAPGGDTAGGGAHVEDQVTLGPTLYVLPAA